MRGIKISREVLSVSHLLFADDCYLFFKVDGRAIEKILTEYGQRINLLVSKSTRIREKRWFSRTIRVNRVEKPCKHLGTDFENINNKRVFFPAVLDKIHSKLAHWKAKCLSHGGKLPLYMFSSFRARSYICNKIDQIMKLERIN